MYLDAGTPHALCPSAHVLVIVANSVYVLRAGLLPPKHLDVDELLACTSCSAQTADDLAAATSPDRGRPNTDIPVH